MIDKISITKQIITAPSRKLTATWSSLPDKPPFPLKGVSEMNKEEQADEIIRRLSQPYKTPSERLEEEIDDEIMTEMIRMYSIFGTHSNDKESNT